MSAPRTLLAGLVATVLIAVPAGAQQVGSPIIPFLEGTDVFWTVNDESGDWFPYKLEANIFPHLVVTQTFSDVINVQAQDARGPDDIKEFAYSISGTPAVRIRMLRDVSAPVRTPSYMPRVNAQLLWARGLKEGLQRSASSQSSLGDQVGGSARMIGRLAELPSVSLWEAHVIVGHHSNGQDGCPSTEQRRQPPEAGDCEPTAVRPTAETINRSNGSFSTNYVRAGINYSRNWMAGTRELEAIREARIGAEFEYHPRPWIDEAIADVYGRARFLLTLSYAAKGIGFCERRLEGASGLTWNPGVVDTVSKAIVTFQVSCFPVRRGGWGVFARVYRGQDYYNVGFLDTTTRFHIGATFNQTGFFRFAKP